jgi:hypothetical protein
MRTTNLTVLLTGAALLIVAPALAHADSYWEVESARANARAGGPVSERDKELLERYGCLSGTDSAFCRQLRSGNSAAYRAKKRKE